MTIKIGDTLYRHDRYRNKHDQRWIPVVICGETKQSWLYAPFGEANETRCRINKKTMLGAADFRGSKDRYYTQQGMADHSFCAAWARPVGQAVQTCTDPDKLKKIAEIIGMEIA